MRLCNIYNKEINKVKRERKDEDVPPARCCIAAWRKDIARFWGSSSPEYVICIYLLYIFIVYVRPNGLLYVIYVFNDSLLFVIYLSRVWVYKPNKGGEKWEGAYRRYTPLFSTSRIFYMIFFKKTYRKSTQT